MDKGTTKRPKVLLGKIPLMETRNGEKVSTSQRRTHQEKIEANIIVNFFPICSFKGLYTYLSLFISIHLVISICFRALDISCYIMTVKMMFSHIAVDPSFF